jgi:pantothenate synthetase
MLPQQTPILEKIFQQLQIVKKMVSKNKQVNVIGCPIQSVI